jgi:hypothetical protein
MAEAETNKVVNCRPGPPSGSISGSLYGLGFIGALIYFLQHAAGFWPGVLGILKAIVWPIILVYKLLEFLHV